MLRADCRIPSLSNQNCMRNLLCLILFIACIISPDIYAQSPIKIIMKDEVKTGIDYDNRYLQSLPPEKSEIDTLEYRDGVYYPKYTFPAAGSFLCIPQKGNGYNYIAEKMIKADGVIYYSLLPDNYLIVHTHPAVSMLGFTDASKSANVFIPTGFIRLALKLHGNKYENLNVYSKSTPLSGWMIFDGTSLHPSEEATSGVNINIRNNPSEIFLPILADYTYDLVFNLQRGVSTSAVKKVDNFTVGRGEIKTIYLEVDNTSSDTIPAPHTPPIPRPKPPMDPISGPKEFPLIPDEEVADSISQSIKTPSCRKCNFSEKTTARKVAESLWIKLNGEEKWSEKQKKNWNSWLPFEQWAGISKNQNGLYDIDIRSGYNMDIAAGLATKILDYTDYTLPKDSQTTDLNAPPFRNRPSGYKAEKDLAIVIDGCQDLNKLVLIYTEITDLTIKNCANLTELAILGNSIERLNIICCPNLTKVAASVNRLETLDIDACPGIEMLFCPGNFITELNLSGLPKLEKLNCAINFLQSLDVTNNTNLKELICYYNQIKELDLSSIKSLELLICAANDHIKVTPSLDILKMKGLKKYNIEGTVKSKGSNNF